MEELLIERGIDVDHVTVYRRVQRFTPLLIDAAGPDAWTNKCVGGAYATLDPRHHGDWLKLATAA